jgi:hypothetical protein
MPTLKPAARAKTAERIRIGAAKAGKYIATHNSNGDEQLYPERWGNYSKGLLHDAKGDVRPNSYNMTVIRWHKPRLPTSTSFPSFAAGSLWRVGAQDSRPARSESNLQRERQLEIHAVRRNIDHDLKKRDLQISGEIALGLRDPVTRTPAPTDGCPRRQRSAPDARPSMCPGSAA